tara:strand:- start:954 stop:1070 length:117 start_codon:yes stop_codon:yes gene_type:complete
MMFRVRRLAKIMLKLFDFDDPAGKWETQECMYCVLVLF